MYVGAPGIPQNIQASIQLISTDHCAILLHWDQPIIDATRKLISHFVVDVENVTLMIPQFTIAALTIKSCNLSVVIAIRAVDICGHKGARAEVVLKDVLQDTGSDTECLSQNIAASQPDANTCPCRLIFFNVSRSV